ncbi:LexA family protein [Pseudomonas matsuisoli]|uniref:Ultraviolet light resistance protein A n=1 Tax=Pseudomonas matsuisoli TaxID=1515666 RepID=A0A917UZT1_9PSED|nr:S24 family peptidase [Pseudomonas matsuisoli]GGK02253.1 ultraviolet light resistance protein A [Pseudomonas matsuisoli]
MARVTAIYDHVPGTSSVPIYSYRVPAGFPSPAQDHIEGPISLDELMNLRAPHTFYARCGGESLTGIGIFEGDLMVVDRSIEPSTGSVAIVSVNGDPIVKIFTKRKDGQIVLESANERFPPRYILEGDELAIWGVVEYSVRFHGKA